jgi:aldehyde:ferredoxin oxidoreductase
LQVIVLTGVFGKGRIKMYGWMGTILRVDLTSGKIEKEPLSDYLRLNYLGGRGVNSRIIWEEVKPHTDGLAPENVLVFGAGPLNGTLAPSGGRFQIGAMSPLTHILGRSNSGGFFAPELKYAGYDHIVFTGKADKPVYLWIDDDTVELKDARHLWGKTVSQTIRMIREEMNDSRIQTACIGPAGENLNRAAVVMVSTDCACGKCGMGAVMGSKNLKVVAVRGTRGIKIARPEQFREIALKLHKAIMENPKYPTFSHYGTLEIYDKLSQAGELGAKNLQEAGYCSEYECHSAENWTKQFRTSPKSKACFGCPMHCHSWFEIKEGPFAGEKGVMPEYAAQCSLGPLCGNKYAPAIFRISNTYGNDYGIDYLDLSNSIAILMDWYEHGVISKEEMDGIDLRWGNWPAMIEMTEKVIKREGFGDVIASIGVVGLAKKLGKGAENYLSHSKGALYNEDNVARTNVGFRLGIATATRGADHLSGATSFRPGTIMQSASMWRGPKINPKLTGYEDQAAPVYYVQTVCSLADSLGLCKFNTARTGEALGVAEMAEMFSTATGVEADKESFNEIADRIWNVERAFIVREGITRQDDNVFGKPTLEPLPSGPYKGFAYDPKKWGKLLDEYYDLNGWDRETGIPTRARLEALGLADVADELANMGKLPAEAH